MPFTTGTATDYHDLLDKLRLWVTGTVGWTQLRWTAPGSITDRAELWVRGPGAGTDRQVYIGFESRNDVTAGAYGWSCRGAIGYDAGAAFELQPGAGSECFFNTWQNNISYWFYANDRRVIVVAKVGTTYHSYYGGFMLPFALPAEYPFPLYVGASYGLLAEHDINNAGNRMIADPGDAAAFYRRRDVAAWKHVANHLRTQNANFDPIENHILGKALMWPFRVGAMYGPYFNTDWNQKKNFHRWRPNANDESPLYQCHIMDLENSVLVGALDGVFAAPGFNRTSEQVVTVGGRTFRYFQNVFRSTGRDFMAIEEL